MLLKTMQRRAYWVVLVLGMARCAEAPVPDGSGGAPDGGEGGGDVECTEASDCETSMPCMVFRCTEDGTCVHSRVGNCMP